MPSSRRNSEGPARIRRNQVTRAIFEATAALGITEREQVERLAQETMRRLDLTPPLPGMASLVFTESQVAEPPKAEASAPAKEAVSQASPPATDQSRVREAPTAVYEVEAPRPTLSVPHVNPGPQPVTAEACLTECDTEVTLTDNARTVLERRYLKKNEQRQVIETPEDMLRRVAHNIAQAEVNYGPDTEVHNWEEKFYGLMTRLEFLPNSPTLMNAGRDLQQLSACFVLPIEDSMEAIFDAIKYTALIHKSGGGTGFSFSRLRPESDIVGSTGGVASGPVSFMRAFDMATEVIKQGGTRRGANMAILNVEHPDVLRFISAKQDNVSLQNFNISVAITERFMQAVERGEDYDLINPRTGKPAGKLNAREVFRKMVDNAWRNGDPGIVFLDRINRDNPTPHLGAIESTNPCGEQPLLPYESCNLGSINLSLMLRKKGERYEVDWKKLGETVDVAVRFLDNVIDMSRYPVPQIDKMTRTTRKIGLGVMGFADMLILLGIPYNSQEALEMGEKVMESINKRARKASEALAEVRGPFPAFQGSISDGGAPIRNSTRTTIAPTGTLSIIAGCSSGIEPLFALSYVRNILDNDKLIEVHPLFEQAAKARGFYSDALMKELAEKGCARDIEGIPDDVKTVFVTAHDITPEWHVKMQAAFQRHTDNAVSKTINFPHDATVEDVEHAYMLAFKEGCKGITIYRDRSREQQVLTVASKGPAAVEAAPVATVVQQGPARIQPRQRPTVTAGQTYKVVTGCGNLYVTVNCDQQGHLVEVFSHLGKAGGCAAAQGEATSRMISLALRSGIDPDSVVSQLRGIRCPSIAWDQGHAVLSCPDALGSVLGRTLGQEPPGHSAIETAESSVAKLAAGESAAPVTAPSNGHGSTYGAFVNMAGQCPECSSVLVYQEGCYVCPSCGYTKC